MTQDQNTMTDTRPYVFNVNDNSGTVNIDASQNYYCGLTTSDSKPSIDWNLVVKTLFGTAGLLFQLLQILWGF